MKTEIRKMVKVFKLNFSLFLILFSFQNFTFSQCPGGAIGVAGAGCGCLAGCDLSGVGGPNCGGVGVGGNCTAGTVAMSLDIVVPDGCTFTVTATMANAPGCTASGADAGDFLKVDIPAGPKPNQTGAGNATITDNYTLAGPATIRISGGANRQDEIIVYSVTFAGAFCVACASILPIELTSFSAEQNGEFVELMWSTGSELNNDYFTLERSRDGLTFESLAIVDAIGTSNSQQNYKIYDTSPLPNISYYRLKQTDQNGTETYFEIISVNRTKQEIYYFNEQLILNLSVAENDRTYLINVFDISGNLIESFFGSNNNNVNYWQEKGIFLLEVPELNIREKIVCF